MIILNNRLKITFLIIGIILFIPFIAMQFSNQVKWRFIDFFIAGILLTITGLIIELINRRITNKKRHFLFYTGTTLLLIFIWMELAVGIFGTSFAGD